MLDLDACERSKLAPEKDNGIGTAAVGRKESDISQVF